MLLEYKEVNRKKSEKLLFWNKNNIKTCPNTSINIGNSQAKLLKKRGQ